MMANRRGLSASGHLPDEMDPGSRERYLVNGWYNFGLVALRARSCDEAKRRLEEALAISPSDETVHWAVTLAQGCPDVQTDRFYYEEFTRLDSRYLEE